MSSNAPSIDEDSDYRISKVSSMSALSASSVNRRNNLRDRRRIAKHLMLLLTITSYLTSVLTRKLCMNTLMNKDEWTLNKVCVDLEHCTVHTTLCYTKTKSTKLFYVRINLTVLNSY